MVRIHFRQTAFWLVLSAARASSCKRLNARCASWVARVLEVFGLLDSSGCHAPRCVIVVRGPRRVMRRGRDREVPVAAPEAELSGNRRDNNGLLQRAQARSKRVTILDDLSSRTKHKRIILSPKETRKHNSNGK
uniref:Secreted protein n=1 Tax=Mycena chlorophos TaxID=658473 RepID=A0ABQ0M9V2_MYCCL|nr:predicted protein [Mycena chlorophos]